MILRITTTLLAVLLILTLNASAQEGVLSFVDIDPVPNKAIAALCNLDSVVDVINDQNFLQFFECLHNTEIIDVDAFEDCIDDSLQDCEPREAYPMPFFPETLGYMVGGYYDEIFFRYVWNVTMDLTLAIHLCPCFDVLANGPCRNAIENYITKRALGVRLANYWVEIFTTSLAYLDQSLWWEIPFPLLGAVVTPVNSVIPKPDSLVDVAQDPDNVAYFLQEPTFLEHSIPTKDSDFVSGLPGIPRLESKKDAIAGTQLGFVPDGFDDLLRSVILGEELAASTLLEYNEFGFSTIFEAYGEMLPWVFFTSYQGCFLISVPIFLPVVVPKASTTFKSVAEGYEVPDVFGIPIVINPFSTVVPYSMKDLMDATGITNAGQGLLPVIEWNFTSIGDVLSCDPVRVNSVKTRDVRPILSPYKAEELPRGNHQRVTLQHLFSLYEDELGNKDDDDDDNDREIFTAEDKAAIKVFQEANELPDSDDPNARPETWKYRSKVLCEGDGLQLDRFIFQDPWSVLVETPYVTELQRLLVFEAALVPGTFLPGSFDGATAKALKDYQKKKGLHQEAITSPETWLALMAFDWRSQALPLFP